MAKLLSLGDIAYCLYPIIPLSWLYALTKMHARVIYHLHPKERLAVRNNLLTTFGETKSGGQIDLMTRQFFEFNQLRALLLFLFPKLNPSQRDALFPIVGLRHLDCAVSRNRGVILLGSHVNSICTFMAIMILRNRGYDVRVAMPTKVDPYAATVVRKAINRTSRDHTFLDQIGGFYVQFNIRPIVQSLSDKAIVAQTGDGLHSVGFVEVEFLNRLLPFTTGTMSIAQMTGSVVVPIFAVGTPPDRMTIIIEEGFTVERGEQPKEDLRWAVAKYVKRLEHYLLGNIPCWQHWLIPDALDAMATWPGRSLDERYEV